MPSPHVRSACGARPSAIVSADLVAPAAGAQAYRGVIATAGGRELESLHKSGLAVAMYASPPYEVAVPAMAAARLSINLTDSAVTGGLDGERARRFEARRHSLFLTPAGAAAAWRKERPSRHINLYFDADTLRDDEALKFPSGALLNGALPSARTLIEMLAAELARGGAFAAEAVDSLARLIVVQLARRQIAAGGDMLAPAQRARIDEFIAAHLERRLLVGELAALVGLPVARFTLAFARSAGKPPHQYVLDRRVQRAGELLRGSSQPLADVAAACGFASQQHMTLLVRRRLGSTPAKLRRAQ